jgi:endonuclease/exonuclease/phosphatase (EEP) superfamily protein YafD
MPVKSKFFNILLKIIRVFLQIVNVVVIISLLTIHFIIKEQSYWDSIRFYIFPLPVIIVIVLVASVFLKKWKYNIVLAGLLSIIWLARSFKVHIPDKIEENDLEVVFWNASRDNNFDMAIAENSGVPDVMVLAESTERDLKGLREKYPRYFFYKSTRELIIFSKKRIKVLSDITSNYNTSVINFSIDSFNFYAVDVTGSTDVPRKWKLDYINEMIIKKRHTIVLGDFNVPYESKYLKQLKDNYQHAFNKKGNGLRETWFYNLPILSLDHIWVSKDLKVLKTQKLFTMKSDHSMIKTFIKR